MYIPVSQLHDGTCMIPLPHTEAARRRPSKSSTQPRKRWSRSAQTPGRRTSTKPWGLRVPGKPCSSSAVKLQQCNQAPLGLSEYVCVCLYACYVCMLCIYLCMYIWVCFMHLSMYVCIYPSISLSINPSIHLFSCTRYVFTTVDTFMLRLVSFVCAMTKNSFGGRHRLCDLAHACFVPYNMNIIFVFISLAWPLKRCCCGVLPFSSFVCRCAVKKKFWWPLLGTEQHGGAAFGMSESAGFCHRER